MEDLKGFYKGKKVLITGHTGFKGSWLCNILLEMDAQVFGYSLEPPTKPSLYELCGLEERLSSFIGDIRDLSHLKQVFDEVRPEIVIHMAAQPLVRESYANPVLTFDTNVMGTVNVLECIRLTESVKSVVNVTTDKVYLNEEINVPFKEFDRLCGRDPYSNSKSCSELVTYSYIKSFFENIDRKIAVSTCRAGNVIGGGDFAKDRIVPDCYRAVSEDSKIILRNPKAVRPFQHVLEPLFAYLTIAKKQYEDSGFAGNYNIGPETNDCIDVGTLAGYFCECWNELDSDKNAEWTNIGDNGPHEAHFLSLDCSRVKEIMNISPVWDSKEAVRNTVEWYFSYYKGVSFMDLMKKQINDYMK